MMCQNWSINFLNVIDISLTAWRSKSVDYRNSSQSASIKPQEQIGDDAERNNTKLAVANKLSAIDRMSNCSSS